MNSLLIELEKKALQHPNKIALISGENEINYQLLLKQLKKIIGDLEFFRITANDRVLVAMPNGAEMGVLCMALMDQATAVPLNPDYRAAEYEQIILRIAPKFIITLFGEEHPLREAAKKLKINMLSLVKNAKGELEIVGEKDILLSNSIVDTKKNDNQTSLILFTSGTTSEPKAVPLTLNNLLTSVNNLIASLRLDSVDRVLHFLPMFHIGGLVDVLIAPLISGGTVCFLSSFSAPEFYSELDRFDPTWTQAVPVMIQEILAQKTTYYKAHKKYSLKFLRSVSAPLSQDTMKNFEASFGVPVIEIFGMTEAAGVITSNPLPPKRRKVGSVGVAAGSKISILDFEGKELDSNKTGQIVVKTNSLMGGYLGGQEDHDTYFNSFGFRTGDLGYLDSEGYLFITGRLKDIINRGGEKITPFEVDQIIISHPSVEDAACFPVPHEKLGEDISAIYVVKPGKLLDPNALQQWLRCQLAHFKVPKTLTQVSNVPRSNGKLQRSKLSEIYHKTNNSISRPDFEVPEDPIAVFVAGIWTEVLNQHDIGLKDNFFDLGGDSLKAASFINQLQKRFGSTIYVSSLFDAPTLSEYKQFLSVNYPELVAAILGEKVLVKSEESPKVTPLTMANFKSAICHPAPSKNIRSDKNKRAVFILSAPRSGSTLLRVMLAGNESLFSPPELYLLSFDTLLQRREWYSGSQRFQLEGNVRALMQILNKPLEEVKDFVRELEDKSYPTHEYYKYIQEVIGENRILVDKTPAYAVDLATLQRAEQYFDEPYYIYLYRHPYGMIRSFEEAKLEQLWYPRLTGSSQIDSKTDFTQRQIAEMIWYILNENISIFLKNIPIERQFKVSFEDLVSDPRKEMSTLCKSLGIEFTDEMLNPRKDEKVRMTDGIHSASKMIGDPKFHQHRAIDPSVADQWKNAYSMDFLSEQTWTLAHSLGFDETIADVLGRVELDL